MHVARLRQAKLRRNPADLTSDLRHRLATVIQRTNGLENARVITRGGLDHTTQGRGRRRTTWSRLGAKNELVAQSHKLFSGAFQRGHRQAVATELVPVQLGVLAMAGPDDRAAGVVDRVRDPEASL